MEDRDQGDDDSPGRPTLAAAWTVRQHGSAGDRLDALVAQLGEALVIVNRWSGWPCTLERRLASASAPTGLHRVQFDFH